MRKTYLVAFLLSLMVLSLVLVNTAQLSEAQSGTQEGGTQVSGIITTDTTWTKANSPYNLTGNVLVGNGATLTIEAGVTVNLNNAYILVNGTLSARGTPSNPINVNHGSYIAFTPFSSNWNEQTSTGSIIENSILNSVQLFIYSSPKITNNIFQNGYIEIVNVWLFSGVYVPSTNSSPNISDNIILGSISIANSWGYGGSPNTACPQISNNIITAVPNRNEKGISTFYSTGLISNNTISGFQTGLYLYSDHGTIVEGNLIIGNTDGIVNNIHQDPATPIIKNNTIAKNVIGIYLYRTFPAATNPVILNNNIYANINYDIKLGVPDNINATHNWWGTTDTQVINQTIYDFKDDFYLGTVNFVPFLDAPHPAAPTFIITSAGTGGSITPSGYIRVSYGGSQTFTFSANTGYHIADVLVNGTSVGAVSSYTLNNITDVTTISAIFAPDPTPTPTPTPHPSYRVIMTHIGEGTISPADGTHIVSSPITLSASPAPNYEFMCWLQNGTVLSSDNPYTYQPNNDYVITAIFYDPVAKDTPTPTPTPTANPTTQPTSGPTSNPTSNPTTQPTANPTNSSIESPTSSPSPSPTIPEFTAVMLLSLFMAVLSIALVLRKRVSKDALT